MEGGAVSDLQGFWKDRAKGKRYRYGLRICVDSR
jgi:hypothetical protein